MRREEGRREKRRVWKGGKKQLARWRINLEGGRERGRIGGEGREEKVERRDNVFSDERRIYKRKSERKLGRKIKGERETKR